MCPAAETNERKLQLSSKLCHSLADTKQAGFTPMWIFLLHIAVILHQLNFLNLPGSCEMYQEGQLQVESKTNFLQQKPHLNPTFLALLVNSRGKSQRRAKRRLHQQFVRLMPFLHEKTICGIVQASSVSTPSPDAYRGKAAENTEQCQRTYMCRGISMALQLSFHVNRTNSCMQTSVCLATLIFISKQIIT